jgi:uncharacterized membrane protein (DUF373 family)
LGINKEESDPILRAINRLILLSIKILAILMALVIFWGIGDVLYILYQRLTSPPMFLLKIDDILFTFGAFLAVLIAIEIYLNITLYLKENCIHVELVLATALMAIARKVIVFDFKELDWKYVAATAPVILSLGITYWLLARRRNTIQDKTTAEEAIGETCPPEGNLR